MGYKSFKKGDPKPPGSGRKKGSLNRTTAEMKEAFRLIVDANLDNFSKWIADIAKKNPAKAMELVLELSKRHIPILSHTKIEGEIKTSRVPPTIIKTSEQQPSHAKA